MVLFRSYRYRLKNHHLTKGASSPINDESALNIVLTVQNGEKKRLQTHDKQSTVMVVKKAFNSVLFSI